MLEYGPDSPRREIRGYMQPVTSDEPVEPGRQPVITTWRLFTFSPVGARERVEWKARPYRVDGEPEAWEPRPGRARYWVRLIEVEG
ncbi:hypothetical protein FKR81_32485 [Lentzea tibetensis]|uniref:Head-tail adaptor protein n=1 Tax=Lentzea tibetensis TaxID=2591470 RepID=A0A563EKM9_9PSEU|nr:hypothetical protein [Lentzea tibetensis]TWP47432.1 hypothetical protein FKR81_32485 [Lentzea tibetensis]